MRHIAAVLLLAAGTAACSSKDRQAAEPMTTSDSLLAQYDTVKLTADLTQLSDSDRQLLPLLIQAAQDMDSIYWLEVAGPVDSVLGSITDPDLKRLARINYGPWERLNEDKPFVRGVGPKPAGARFYPADMTKAEFDSAAARAPDKGVALRSLYTLVQRDSSGALVTVPYHEAFAAHTKHAAELLRQAAALASGTGLKRYLTLRAAALESDDYRVSDVAWLDMKDNTVDIVIGPIETYEDQLFGYKAAHEAYVLIKDQDWSRRLARYAALLPALQRGLPVEAEYRKEKPGTDSDLNAYDAVYYAGQANAGGKTIAINLPNDEQVQLQKGTRRLQLKNTMRAKFDRILVPIADALIARDQQANISFNAFFQNTMFHEVAHGLGIKNTLNGRGTVREALKEQYSALEEARADLVALYFLPNPKLAELGLVRSEDQADIVRTEYEGYTRNALVQLRRVREGTQIEEDHMRNRQMVVRWLMANTKAIDVRQRDGKSYYVMTDPVAFQEGVGRLLAEIQRIKAEGDYAAAKKLFETYGVHFDPKLRDEVVARVDHLNMPSYTGFVQPKLTAVTGADGKITDVKISYPMDLTTQMLEYSGRSKP
ncbi:MAG TPA: hypothetical protein VFL88_03625 [Gemmatimonadales bacterium]|nr:hypothetical protein [Gemmatimonadales bacterium]